MAEESKESKDKDVFTKGIQKAAIWLGFAVTVSGLIGSYYVSQYKTGEVEKITADHEARIRVLERTNPELVLQQLKSIEAINTQMDNKITTTNQRIDEVLKVLINK